MQLQLLGKDFASTVSAVRTYSRDYVCINFVLRLIFFVGWADCCPSPAGLVLE